MEKLTASDYIALLRNDDFREDCKNRLLENGLIDEEDFPTPKADPIIEKLVANEQKLQMGIKIAERKKTDPLSILNTGLHWKHTVLQHNKKTLNVTLNPCFLYIGMPKLGLVDETTKNKFNPKDDFIEKNLILPNNLKEAKPVYYQQTALDGMKFIWFKYGSDYLAIQSCYYDFIIDKFKDIKWYCNGIVNTVYALGKKKEFKGLVMPYDTTNVVERPKL